MQEQTIKDDVIMGLGLGLELGLVYNLVVISHNPNPNTTINPNPNDYPHPIMTSVVCSYMGDRPKKECNMLSCGTVCTCLP